jgi:hypothetical protein
MTATVPDLILIPGLVCLALLAGGLGFVLGFLRHAATHDCRRREDRKPASPTFDEVVDRVDRLSRLLEKHR